MPDPQPAQPESSWKPPTITLKWGSYTKSDPDEEQKQVTAVGLALDKGIITKRCAVEKLRHVFDIENVDAFLEALEEESAKNQERQVENAKAMAEAVPPKPAMSGEKKPQPGQPKPPPGKQ